MKKMFIVRTGYSLMAEIPSIQKVPSLSQVLENYNSNTQLILIIC